MANPNDPETEHAGGNLGHGYSVLLNDLYKVEDDRLYAVVKSHLELGQDPNKASDFGETPLGQAFFRGRMDVFKLLLEHGADIDVMEWSGLHQAVALGTVDDVTSLAWPNALLVRDRNGLTPFLLAVDIGDVEKADMLLAITPKSGRFKTYHKQPAMIVAAEKGRSEVISWLLNNGFDVDEADEFGGTALIAAVQYDRPKIVDLLLNHGASISAKYNLTASVNAIDRISWPEELQELSAGLDDGESYLTPMSETESLNIALLLIAAGAAPGDFTGEVIRKLTGAVRIPKQQISPNQFDAQKYRVFGQANPEQVDFALWREMVRTGMSAFEAHDAFGRGQRDYKSPAIWSFDRFGMSTTKLPDGRWVQVAGEHEDYYDEDFQIYNDVFVHDGQGGLSMFAYPRDVFPPTDFHSATLVGDEIYLIGNLGYPQDRKVDHTQVLRLNLTTFQIDQVVTTGAIPGWISSHGAVPVNGEIVVSDGGLDGHRSGAACRAVLT
ncbi:MAG: ankyrin repeat domain-containing protein [Pseudomonadota bacterium]